MRLSERHVEQALVDRVSAAGGLAIKFVSPAMSGMPDRIVVMPGGRIAFVELKRPGERPRPLQVRMHQMLIERGADVRVVDDLAAVEQLVAQMSRGRP